MRWKLFHYPSDSTAYSVLLETAALERPLASLAIAPNGKTKHQQQKSHMTTSKYDVQSQSASQPSPNHISWVHSCNIWLVLNAVLHWQFRGGWRPNIIMATRHLSELDSTVWPYRVQSRSRLDVKVPWTRISRLSVIELTFKDLTLSVSSQDLIEKELHHTRLYTTGYAIWSVEHWEGKVERENSIVQPSLLENELWAHSLYNTRFVGPQYPILASLSHE